MARPHVFDELRTGLGLRKHSHGQKRKLDSGPSLFFPSTKGWRDMTPPKTLEAWRTGPFKVLQALGSMPVSDHGLMLQAAAQQGLLRVVTSEARLFTLASRDPWTARAKCVTNQ